jgi:hypothetical protein
MTTSAAGLTTSEQLQGSPSTAPSVVADGHRRSVIVELLLKFRNRCAVLLGAATVAGLSGERRSFFVIL